MWKIIDKLYLGTRDDSADLVALEEKQITHIVNCASELRCSHSDSFEFLHLSLTDPDDRLRAQLPVTLDFIDRGRQSGAVLVHCRGGVSRSPSVVLAYLCHIGLDLTQAAQTIQSVIQTRPNEVFLRQVCDHFGVIANDSEIAALVRMLGE